MNRVVSNIIEGLHERSVSSSINESENWKTIAGVRAKVDKDGKVIDEKVKKLIEKRLGKTIDEEDKSKKVNKNDDIDGNNVGGILKDLVDEELEEIDEDEWKTMHGAHILVDDKGGIKAGGPKSLRKKATKKEIEDGVKDANKKSRAAAKNKPIKRDLNKKKNFGYMKDELDMDIEDYGSNINLDKTPDNYKLNDTDREALSTGTMRGLDRMLDDSRYDEDDKPPVISYKGKKLSPMKWRGSQGYYDKDTDDEVEFIKNSIKRAKTLGEVRDILNDIDIK